MRRQRRFLSSKKQTHTSEVKMNMEQKSAKKLIGLTGPSTFTQECTDMIEEFLGANFVLLYHGSSDNLSYWLETVDAVVMAGGVDIHPSVYGESVWANHNLSKFDIQRDCRELKIAEYCRKHHKPLLGICRGHQVIGLVHGIPLVMDIASSLVCHSPQRQSVQLNPKEPAHTVDIVDTEYFYGNYNITPQVKERKVVSAIMADNRADRLWVNSFHHQGLAVVKRDYPGVKILGTARVDMDSCKKIVELMEGDRWVSCQWHPEYDWRDNSASRAVLLKFKSFLN